MESPGRKALADTFLAALQQEQLPWHRCWNVVRPQSFSTGKTYRGINNLTLSFVAEERGYKDPRWMTYHQAQANGWQVRKGEKSSKVEHWHYYDKGQRKNIDADEVRRIQREEPQRMKDIRLTAYAYSVFNAEQVDGVPAWQPPKHSTNIELLALRRDALLTGLQVGFQETGNRAFYHPGSDMITMPPVENFHSDYGYACTLLHEAGHATGHCSRLDRPMEGRFGTPEYAKEELRAEIASAFVAQSLGIPMQEADMAKEIDLHKAYIQDWIQVLKSEPNELFSAIKDADKIADYLLEQGHLQELVTEKESVLTQEAELAAGEEMEPECL